MRIVVVLACLATWSGTAVAQSAPTDAEKGAPAPAAYQPAVLNAPAAETPAVDPAQRPEEPAAAGGGSRRPFSRRAEAVAAQRARIEAQRAALLRDPRFTPQTSDAAKVDEPVLHGDPRARWTIGVSLDSVFYTDAGYDYFDHDNVSPRFGGWAAYDLAELAPRLTLAVEVGFGIESHEQGNWEGALRTELDSQTFSGGVGLRYALAPWLDPQVRVSGGVTRLAFSLDTPDSGRFEDRALSGFGALGAGVLLHTPAQLFENRRGQFSSVSVGVLVEGGYALRSSLDVTLSRSASDHAIPITEANLGELALSGPYIRSSVVVRF